MRSLGVRCHTKSWETHERKKQFGEGERIDIGKSQRLRKEGNARINKVSAMRPGLAKIIEKLGNLRNFETPETDLHIAPNAGWIDFADTGLSRLVHWQSRSQSMNCSTPNYECEKRVEINIAVAWASLTLVRIHPRVAEESLTKWLLATLDDTGWMDHHLVHHGWFQGIPILQPVDVEKAYSYSASHYHCLQWHLQSYGWHFASFWQEEDSMDGRLILHREVCATDGVQTLCSRYSNHGYAWHYDTHPWSFLEVAIV